jgi:uncharacterized membrane protein
MTPFIPLDLPTEVGEHGGHADGFLEPLIGLGFVSLILAVLVVAYVVLRARGQLPSFALPTFGRRSSPEESAKEILAERFAHGDLTTEEFIERASALNWTPGVDTVRPRSIGRG